MNEKKILLAQSFSFHKDKKNSYIFLFCSYAPIYFIWMPGYQCPINTIFHFYNKSLSVFFCCRKLGASRYTLTRRCTASCVVSQNSVQTQNFSSTCSIKIMSFLHWWICLMCFPPKLTSKM